MSKLPYGKLLPVLIRADDFLDLLGDAEHLLHLGVDLGLGCDMQRDVLHTEDRGGVAICVADQRLLERLDRDRERVEQVPEEAKGKKRRE